MLKFLKRKSSIKFEIIEEFENETRTNFLDLSDLENLFLNNPFWVLAIVSENKEITGLRIHSKYDPTDKVTIFIKKIEGNGIEFIKTILKKLGYQ